MRPNTRRQSIAATVLATVCLVTFTARSSRAQTAASNNDPDAPKTASSGTESDILEPINRAIFKFNDTLDVYMLEPVARGWRKILPEPIHRGFTNFFTNLRSPIVIANDLLQGKFVEAATNTGRFFVNTGLGLGGFVDITANDGQPRNDEDFGQTLGVWHVPSGPYIVLPILGPSTVRDALGSTPDYYFAIWPDRVKTIEYTGEQLGEAVQWRSTVLDEVEDAKKSSLDYYTFVRNLYLQKRESLIRDGEAAPAESEDELYYFDDEDE